MVTSENAAPAEMPGVEEIHAAFVEAQRQYRAERDAALAKQGYWPDRSPAPLDVLAKVAQALFAPILAEKEREIERACADHANATIGWERDRGRADDAEARALAAEAALAGLRQNILDAEIQSDDDDKAQARLDRLAAALRAEGE